MKPIEAEYHYKKEVVDDNGNAVFEDGVPKFDDVFDKGILIDIIVVSDLVGENQNADGVWALFLIEGEHNFFPELLELKDIRIPNKSVHNYVSSFYSK
jgi:hypothetical protein